MKIWRVPGLLLLRRLTRVLEGILDQQRQQTKLLARLADHFAPADPITDPEVVASHTGASYVDPADQALILGFVERTVRETGHHPDDDEILAYLADEKTQDLHKRLIDRDAELARLAEERRIGR